MCEYGHIIRQNYFAFNYKLTIIKNKKGAIMLPRQRRFAMYYYYNDIKKTVGYYRDLEDALHGEPKDIEHFNELDTEEKMVIFCENINLNCYISESKDDLLAIMQDMEIDNFEELKKELLSF